MTQSANDTPTGTGTDTAPRTPQDRIRDGIGEARQRAESAYDTARAKAGDAAKASRQSAHDAANRTADAVEANPLGVVAGGLALGAIVAALLPRGAREKELLAPIGKRVGATAAAAIAAAKQAGFDELDSRGLTRDAAKDGAKSLLKGIAKAAQTAGKAAADAGREEAKNR